MNPNIQTSPQWIASPNHEDPGEYESYLINNRDKIHVAAATSGDSAALESGAAAILYLDGFGDRCTWWVLFVPRSCDPATQWQMRRTTSLEGSQIIMEGIDDIDDDVKREVLSQCGV